MKILQKWGMFCLACVPAGCGSDIGPTPPVAGDPNNVEDIVFTEDSDPAMAALPFVDDELLVQPYPGADVETLTGLYDDVGAVVVEDLVDIELSVLKVPHGELQAIATRLAESGLIETIQKNYVYMVDGPPRTPLKRGPQRIDWSRTVAARTGRKVPDDPLYSQQTHLTRIRAADAWERTLGGCVTPDSSRCPIVIAVVDTGVDRNHPDLAGKIVDGWNVYGGNSDYSDVHGHGTLVAGVAAAASDNNLGVVGVAPDSPLVVIRVADDLGQSTAGHLAAGILRAVNHGARVINVSFAPLWSNRVVQVAAQEAFNRGSLVVISAGNSGQTTAARGYSEALFVGAVDSSDGVAYFSDRGPFVDLVAPGTGILGTGLDGGYDMTDGTSFAAPIVSGVAALAWSVNPDLRPVSIEAAILDSAADLGAVGKDDLYGYGAVDAAAAVDEASYASFVPDDTPPNLQVRRPAEGAVLTGRSTAWVTATDTSGVADVVLYIDGVPYATDRRADYRFVIDTARFPASEHELAFVATDMAGNASPAESVMVMFRSSSAATTGQTTSAIVFRSPADGALVSGDVNVQASVSDTDGLTIVEWFVDAEAVFVGHVSGETTGVSYMWRTAEVLAGRHTITLVVTDERGDQTTGQLDLITR